MPIVPSWRISWQRLASSQTALNQRHRGVTKTGTQYPGGASRPRFEVRQRQSRRQPLGL
jgi:hypothetical protein